MKLLRILLPALLLFMATGNAVAQKLDANTPHYWTWRHYSADVDWDDYFTKMTETGIRGIVLQCGPNELRKVIPIAKKHGVTVYAWLWVINDGGIAHQHPEWLDYNRNGESLKDKKAYVDYYKFLSPIIPGVRKAIAEKIEEVAKVEGLGGISLDYCRYVDQILPTTLWAQYGIVQDKEYAEWDYGYHPEMLKAFEKKYGYDPSKLEDPSQDSVWLQFRLDQVTEVANMLADIAHRNSIAISASPFPTPSMARRMVRQDWGRWKLDVAFPMIYQGFYNGDADWIANCVRECVTVKPETMICCGLHVPDFYSGGKDGKPTLTEAMGAAISAGAKGIAFFTFDAMNEEMRAEVRRFIDAHPME